MNRAAVIAKARKFLKEREVKHAFRVLVIDVGEPVPVLDGRVFVVQLNGITGSNARG